jgi:NADH-quinone oxidoreductase subunit G
MGLDELEQADAVLLVGSYPRHDQPLVNERLRKAISNGAKVVSVGSVAYEFNIALHASIVVRPSEMATTLAGIGGALLERTEADVDEQTRKTLNAAGAGKEQQEIAQCLLAAERSVVLLGSSAQRHTNRSGLRALAGLIASLSGGRLGHLTQGANAAGGWLAGSIPHRGPGAREVDDAGLDAAAMLDKPLDAYLLLGLEPDLDCLDGARARDALGKAGFVVALSSFQTDALEELADVLLPIALFAENEGTYVNGSGTWQSFDAAVACPGQVRPAWKVLRVLGEHVGLPGFDAVDYREITNEIEALCGELRARDDGPWVADDDCLGQAASGLERIVEIPMYAVDPLVRHATALNQMPQCGDDRIYLSPATLKQMKLGEDVMVDVGANGTRATLATAVDPRLPDNSCLYYGARPATAAIEMTGPVDIKRVD